MNKITADNFIELTSNLGPSKTWELIEKQFEDERHSYASKVRNEQLNDDRVYERFMARVGIAAIIAVVGACVWGIVFGISTYCGNASREWEKDVATCSSGDTVGCLRAVTAHNDGDDPDGDDERLLKKVYEIKVGHPLPSTETGGAQINGFDIYPQGEGLKIDKK